MAALDPNAQSDAQGAQQLHNSGVEVFARSIAGIMSRLGGSDIRMEDITIFSGRKKVFPGDNANNYEIGLKLNEAFGNKDSKASFRVFLEFADGHKEEVYRQTAGKVLTDNFGLADEFRAQYAKQQAEQFTAEGRPKLSVEVDAARPLETVVQELKKPTREDIATATPLSSEQVDQEIEQIKAKAPAAAAQKGLDESSYVGIAQALSAPDWLVEGMQAEAATEADLASPWDEAKFEQNAVEAGFANGEDYLDWLVGQAEAGTEQDMIDMHSDEVNAEVAYYREHPERLEPELREWLNLDQSETLSATPSERLALEAAFDAPKESQAEKTEHWMMEQLIPKSAVVPIQTEMIAAMPETAETISLAHYAGTTLDMVNPAAVAPSDHAGASLAVAPFLKDVSALSAQIEALRDKANSHLTDLQAFAGDMRAAAEPRLTQWAERVEAAVEVKSNTWRDRLQNAASGLLNTVKDRAIADCKIVVEVVKDRAASDWDKTVDAAKSGASNAWESAQRWAIGADEVNKGINTVIDYIGQRNGSDGLASLDGYQFARLGQDTAIFKDDKPIYKNGVMTDKATIQDAAYIARFPNIAEKAAAVVDEMRKNQSVTQTQNAGPVRSR